MRARHRERQSFAYFSSAAARKVRRQQANLEDSVRDNGSASKNQLAEPMVDPLRLIHPTVTLFLNYA